MAGKKNNATSSWSGYNHQGQVGIFLALEKLKELIKCSDAFCDYTVEFEKEHGEDVDIVYNKSVISRHQIKAKTNSRNLNDYKDVLTNFKTTGVKEDSRFLHTICEVVGFGLPEKEFNELPYKPIFIQNTCQIRLFEYPDGKEYCELSCGKDSKIDNFCKKEIYSILDECNNRLRDDDDHIDDILFELKDFLSKKIREAHEKGQGKNPVISFSKIYDIITSTEKRERKSIREAKNLFSRYWNKNYQSFCIEEAEKVLDDTLANAILNLSDKDFQNFIIDLHPQEDIKINLEEQTIFSFLNNNVFEEIFFEFYKVINQKNFMLSELRYDSSQLSYRLSLINNKYKKGEVGKLVQSIRNNQQFLKASFDVDYLVNGRINSPLFEQGELDDGLESPYGQKPSNKDNLFSNNLEFIDIDNTVEKLRGEQYE